MLAGVGRIDDDGKVSLLRIGVGSVAPVPLRLDRVANAVIGQAIDDELLAKARKVAEDEISPIDDVRSTAQYRRTVTANLVVRFLKELQTLADFDDENEWLRDVGRSSKYSIFFPLRSKTALAVLIVGIAQSVGILMLIFLGRFSA